MILYNLFTLAFAFLVLVSFHELGHYLAAKWAGVKVHKFALGFPPWIFSIKLGETVYALGMTLMGGFVRMQGEEMIVGENEKLDDRDYRGKPIWKRAIIILAGPVFSLLLALPITMYCLWSGMLQSPPVIGAQPADSRMVKADLQPGDRVVAMDGTPIYHRSSMIMHLMLNNERNPVEVTVLRTETGPDGTPVTNTYTRTLPAWPAGIDIANDGALFRAGLQAPVWRVGVDLEDSGMQFRRAILALDVHPQKEADPGVAELAGMKNDDEIVAVNGYPLSQFMDLQAYLAAHGEKPCTLQVRRAVEPDPKAGGGAPAAQYKIVDLTLQARDVTGGGGNPNYKIGVLLSDVHIVTAVTPGSAADKAGVKPGMQMKIEAKTGGEPSFVSRTAQAPVDPATGELYEPAGAHTGFTSKIAFAFYAKPAGATWKQYGEDNRDKSWPIAARLELATKPGTLTQALYTPVQVEVTPQPLSALDLTGGTHFELLDDRPERQEIRGGGRLVAATWTDFNTQGYRMLQSLKKIVVDLFSGNRKALGGLAGPLGIGSMLWNQGNMQGDLAFNQYLMFIGFISINLGIMNLLPIPILDGGHLLMMAIEAIRRKPPSEVMVIRFQKVGLVIILGLFLLATSMDVYHLFFPR